MIRNAVRLLAAQHGTRVEFGHTSQRRWAVAALFGRGRSRCVYYPADDNADYNDLRAILDDARRAIRQIEATVTATAYHGLGAASPSQQRAYERRRS